MSALAGTAGAGAAAMTLQAGWALSWGTGLITYGVLIVLWLFLIGIFMMVARSMRTRMQGMDDGGQALFGFGRSRAQRYRRDQGKITFEGSGSTS